MVPGLIVRVVDLDEDYIGPDISAVSGRSAGTAHIYAYAGLDELSTFAGPIEGFPRSAKDERRYDFVLPTPDALVGSGASACTVLMPLGTHISKPP